MAEENVPTDSDRLARLREQCRAFRARLSPGDQAASQAIGLSHQQTVKKTLGDGITQPIQSRSFEPKAAVAFIIKDVLVRE